MSDLKFFETVQAKDVKPGDVILFPIITDSKTINRPISVKSVSTHRDDTGLWKTTITGPLGVQFVTDPGNVIEIFPLQ